MYKLIILLLCLSEIWMSSEAFHWKIYSVRNPVTPSVSKIYRLSANIERLKMSTLEEFSVDKRTIECLDFNFLLNALKKNTVTVLGAKTCGNYSTNDPTQANRQYAMVEELNNQIGVLPLFSKLDLWPLLQTIELNSSPPEREDLSRFSGDMNQLFTLHKFLVDNGDSLPLFEEIKGRLELPLELFETFNEAFDSEDNLNEEKFPVLRDLRSRIDGLRGRIIQTIQSLMSATEMKEKIADTGYTEIDGRFCLMLKNTYKKGVGIVHGSSNTGRTIYVEPMAVVEPTNEMKTLIAEFRAEESAIFFEMCQSIARNREVIKASAEAAAELDIYHAKAKLGRTINGIIPEVGAEGRIQCLNARHPVLLLRAAAAGARDPASAVVGNNMELHQGKTALVISGPNAGGKTIVLKTCGLFALMAKHALPVPCEPRGARVDLFAEVMADIGDMQSVSGDLSTFSGHLTICRQMLLIAKKRHQEVQRGEERLGEGSVHNRCLVLLDEVGTGTDPAQGAALAQAVLEELVELGSRVMVTTHYQRIKELAAHDQRFQIAAMEFIDNKPTYRLRPGSIGESFALEAAKRLQLPEDVLIRANALLDDESRRLIALQERLEQETAAARVKQTEFTQKLKELGEREAAITRAKEKLEVQIEKIREGKTAEFLTELREKEQELEELMLRARSIVSSPSSSSFGENGVSPAKMLSEARDSLRAQRVETEKGVVDKQVQQLEADPLQPGQPLEIGTTLIIMEPGNLYGTRAVVIQRNKGRGRVLVRVAGAELKMDRHLLGVPQVDSTFAGKLSLLSEAGEEKELTAKERRLRKIIEEELVDTDKLLATNKAARKQALRGRLVGATRTAANTLDLREVDSLATAQEKTKEFFRRVVGAEEHQYTEALVLFIQHGVHSAYKDKFRGWLKKYPLVDRIQPAELAQGGDAVTAVEMLLSDA